MDLIDTPPSTTGLRQRREALGLTRQEFAQAVRCSISYLGSLEAGATPARSSGVLARALLVLDHLERAHERRDHGVG
jgi:predicted transcriptional regulator